MSSAMYLREESNLLIRLPQLFSSPLLGALSPGSEGGTSNLLAVSGIGIEQSTYETFLPKLVSLSMLIDFCMRF